MCHEESEAKEFDDAELFALFVLLGVEGDEGEVPAYVAELH